LEYPSSLHEVVRSGRVENVSYFLCKANAVVDAADPVEFTPFAFACMGATSGKY
jgi:hypothetical protein